MATYTNMAALERALQAQLRKAMEETARLAEADMFEETAGFYTKGNPHLYERTGALGDTPQVTPVTMSGNTAECEAYLNTNYRYTTGDCPTGLEVLTIAENHSAGDLNPPLGREGFWQRSEQKIEKDFNATMKKYFK